MLQIRADNDLEKESRFSLLSIIYTMTHTTMTEVKVFDSNLRGSFFNKDILFLNKFSEISHSI